MMIRGNKHYVAQSGRAIIKLILCGAVLLGASATFAAPMPITGNMVLGGNYDFVGGSDLSNATALDLNTVVSTGTADGILGTTISLYESGTINATPLSFDPFYAIPNLLEIGGWQLGIDSLIIDEPRSTESLRLSGTGILSGTGYDATKATWSLSAQIGSTYSMTVTAVPVPAAVWLFGSGLIGLIAVARRQNA